MQYETYDDKTGRGETTQQSQDYRKIIARQDKTRQDKTGQDKDKTRQGKARQGKARQAQDNTLLRHLCWWAGKTRLACVCRAILEFDM
jgi:hypothetical protein